MFKTLLKYFRELFIGGPTFQTYQGNELTWPTHAPINSFPINVYMTESAQMRIGNNAKLMIDYINNELGFKAFLQPVVAQSRDFKRIFADADLHKSNPNLRGLVLIDIDDHLNQAHTTLYYATHAYEPFKEEVGHIRCAYIDMGMMIPTKLLSSSLLHELLHALGLDHDTETSSVMNDWLSVDGTYIITDKTRAALRKKYVNVAVKP